MEKTMARAIYKAMKIGEEYTTRDLLKLLGDNYYEYLPVEQHCENHLRHISDEMWKVVKAGFAKTYARDEILPNVRGLRFGAKPTSFTTYKARYWVKTR